MQNITLDAARGSEDIRVFQINGLIVLYNKHKYRTLFNNFNSFLSVTTIFTYVSATSSTTWLYFLPIFENVNNILVRAYLYNYWQLFLYTSQVYNFKYIYFDYW